MAQKRLRKELQKIFTDPPPGISASLVDESNIMEWRAIVCGPDNTPFEGGTFSLRLIFPESYPDKAPTVVFYSKMFHPNVYVSGRVCLDIIEDPDKWSKDYDAIGVLCGIQSMLGDPNPESPANTEANELFSTNPELYEEIVKRDIVHGSIFEELDENLNLQEARERQELEEQINALAIAELDDYNECN